MIIERRTFSAKYYDYAELFYLPKIARYCVILVSGNTKKQLRFKTLQLAEKYVSKI
jgi:hypothetical protein